MSILTITRVRRVLAPVLLTGLVATTTFAAAPAAVAVSAVASTVASTGPGDAVLPLPASFRPYRIVPGVRLVAKPQPWVLPVRGYRLTGRFGASSGLWSSTHTGLDFAAAEGATISSIAPGTVTEASYDGAFGNKTAVRLDDGTVLWYAHQSAMAVEVGQRLDAGDLVGYVGSTGNVTGPHLHLEVHPGSGAPVDPEAWLPEHRLRA